MSLRPERVLEVLRKTPELAETSAALELDASIDTLGLSSLNLLRVIVRLESEFELEFGDEALDLTRFATIRALCEYVVARADGAPP